MDNEHLDDWVADVQAAYMAGDLVEPPEWIRSNARRLFRTGAAGAVQAPRGLHRRVRAVLVFDSRRPGLATAGVRSSGVVDGPWQLLYRGNDVDVDLLVRPNQDGHTLNVRGQALSLVGDDLCDGQVQAHPSNRPRKLNGSAAPTAPVASSGLEPSGEFALPNLERGRYDVVFSFGSQKIELTDVDF